jgi:predicted nucleic acid-binding protein
VSVVVSDASPLIALQQINQLSLLEAIFGSVVIPPAVTAEITPSLQLPSWINERALSQPMSSRVLRAALGPGESEAIALSLEIGASRLLIDERAGRRLAQGLGLQVTGTLGVLYMAKQQKHVPAIRPAIDALIKAGFRVAPELYEQVIADAGEAEPQS